MTRIIDEDIIRNKPVSDAYRDGWDRVFGDKPEDHGDPDGGEPPPEQILSDAVKEYLAAGGEPSPIGWYGVATIDAPEPTEEQMRRCDGFYDDGIMVTACENCEGCGRIGCPEADFGYTHDEP